MKKLSVFILIGIVSVSLSGCGKTYLDINSPNPNDATSATPELVITNALTVTASVQVLGSTPMNYINGWMGFWGQSGSYATSNTDMASYNETTNYTSGATNPWTVDYRNLEDYHYVEVSSQQQLKPFYEAMAKVMKSIVFGQLVDLFNNVPYKDAFQGTLLIQPKYDDGQTIYETLAGQLDSAVLLMNLPNAVGSGSSDIMFGGDNTLWIQFANTVKLRLLMRQTQVPGRAAYIQTEIGKILANGGGFLTQDAAVNPNYANNALQQNPIWGFFVTLTGTSTSGGQADLYRAGDYGINLLQSTGDPRLGFIYDVNGSGAFKGSILGNNFNPPGTGTSPAAGPGILKSVDQPAIILSASESYFLQAEATVRGFLTGGDSAAKAAYLAGVQASFDYLGAGSDSAYVVSGNPKTTWSVAGGDPTKEIALIIQQKWISDADVTPLEAYDDYRRLHLPADIPISVSNYKNPSNAQIPVRWLYPQSEYTTNAANVNAQGAIDYYTSKVWWNQ